jgi:uncharacterized repeat protein (TIGR03847 family)
MIDFGLVDAVDAEAIGPPGRRTFRLRARISGSYAALWMEKEQLLALGRSFSQLLAERSRQRGAPVGAVEPIGAFPEHPEVDMQIARMGLDFDPEQEHLVLLADDGPALERGDTPAFRMELNRPQSLAVSRLIESLVAAGRPLCPLCKQPLAEPGAPHFCPGSNGHSEDEIPREEADEEEPE